MPHKSREALDEQQAAEMTDKTAFGELQEHLSALRWLLTKQNGAITIDQLESLIEGINAYKEQVAEEAFEAGELTGYYMSKAALPHKKDFFELLNSSVNEYKTKIKKLK